MIKITIIIGSLEVGGAERHLVQTLPFLDPSRYQITLFTLAHRGALAGQLERCGIRVIAPSTAVNKPRGWGRKLLTLIMGTLKLLKHYAVDKPDIVHFYLPQSYLMGALLALPFDGFVQIMSRRSLNLYQAKHPILGRLERKLHGQMDMILGNSQAVIDQLHHDEQVPASKLRLIHNGIDLTPFTQPIKPAQVRRFWGAGPKDLVLVIVANLIPYKGHVDLLEALGQVHHHMPSHWKLWVVGRDDGIQADLEQLAAQEGLSDHVRFLGARRDVPALLQAADIGLLVSHEEGFSNAILEGMAAGLPMIVTNVGGNAEAITHGEHGLVVAPHSPQQLAQAILDLAGDAKLRKKMGKAGAKRVAEQFSMQACVASYQSLYDGFSELKAKR